MSREIVVVIGAGGIGLAIARRQGMGKHLLLADIDQALLQRTAGTLRDAGYDVATQVIDVCSPESVHTLAQMAAAMGPVMQVINTAGVSPNMAPPAKVLEVDLYGAALVFEAFGEVIASGGSGLIVASMAGHMPHPLSPSDETQLALTPAASLLELPCLQPDVITDSMVAYIVAKRANSLRVQAEAVRWGARGARVNAISPGIVVTPLATHELASASGDAYRAMVEASPAKRMSPPDEIAIAAHFLLGQDAGFITGGDLLIDGGVIAAMRAGQLSAPG